MSPLDNVRPLHPGGDPGDGWTDVEVRLPPPRPRITPGRYQARSATLVRCHAFGRETLELGFGVFRGEATDGELIAHGIPYFVRLPGKRGLSPHSKLAKLLYVAGLSPTRWTTVNLAVLRGKLWLVEIGDAAKDADGQPLTPETSYSVVKRIMSRLA